MHVCVQVGFHAYVHERVQAMRTCGYTPLCESSQCEGLHAYTPCGWVCLQAMLVHTHVSMHASLISVRVWGAPGEGGAGGSKFQGCRGAGFTQGLGLRD